MSRHRFCSRITHFSDFTVCWSHFFICSHCLDIFHQQICGSSNFTACIYTEKGSCVIDTQTVGCFQPTVAQSIRHLAAGSGREERAGVWEMPTLPWGTMSKPCTLQRNIWRSPKRWMFTISLPAKHNSSPHLPTLPPGGCLKNNRVMHWLLHLPV